MVNTGLSFGLKKLFYFIFQEGDIANRWFHGFVGPDAKFLKASYFSAAAAIRNLDYRKCYGQERQKNLVITRYGQRPNQAPRSVLWRNHKPALFVIKSTKNTLLRGFIR